MPPQELGHDYCASVCHLPSPKRLKLDHPPLDVPQFLKEENKSSDPKEAKHIHSDLKETQITKPILKETKCANPVAQLKPSKKNIRPEGKVVVSLGGQVGDGDKLSLLLSTRDRGAKERVAAFLFFVHERQNMFELRNNGSTPPYTQNKVLHEMWFTNMYREIDRGTVYLRRGILSSGDFSPSSIVFRTILYRLLNKVETFEKFGKIPNVDNWAEFKQHLEMMQEDGEVIFTGAHQVMGLRRYIETLDSVAGDLANLTARLVESPCLQSCFNTMKEVENVGPFLAWQVVCDLLELRLVDHDQDSWVCLGPGAKLGLSIIFPHIRTDTEELQYAKKLTKLATPGFRALSLDFPPLLNRPLNLKNIEHALCEFSKFWRTSLGMTGKRRLYSKNTSRAHLDNTTCQGCKNHVLQDDNMEDKEFSSEEDCSEHERKDDCLRCVLCGRGWHLACSPLHSVLAGQVTPSSWLCCDCIRLEGRNMREDKVIVYNEEVRELHPLKPVQISMRGLKKNNSELQ